MIRKYKNSHVSIDLSNKGLADSPEYSSMLKEIEECEAEDRQFYQRVPREHTQRV